MGASKTIFILALTAHSHLAQFFHTVLKHNCPPPTPPQACTHIHQVHLCLRTVTTCSYIITLATTLPAFGLFYIFQSNTARSHLWIYWFCEDSKRHSVMLSWPPFVDILDELQLFEPCQGLRGISNLNTVRRVHTSQNNPDFVSQECLGMVLMAKCERALNGSRWCTGRKKLSGYNLNKISMYKEIVENNRTMSFHFSACSNWYNGCD